MKPLYRDLSLQVFVAMILGVAVGYAWPQSADAMKPLGDLFIKLVRMLVAPIVFCTVVHGIASVGQARQVGRVAIKSIIYFELVTTAALVLALLLVNVWTPGAGMHVDPATFTDKSVTSVADTAKQVGFRLSCRSMFSATRWRPSSWRDGNAPWTSRRCYAGLRAMNTPQRNSASASLSDRSLATISKPASISFFVYSPMSCTKYWHCCR